MSYSVTQEEILSLRTDAAAVSVEIALDVSPTPVCQSVARFGGETLSAQIRALRFLPVGSAAEVEAPELPFSRFFAVAAPIWLTGRANEFKVLRIAYRRLFAAVRESGCDSLAMPFLSAMYYRFPKDEAVKIALDEAARSALEVVFAADTPELYAFSRMPYRKPELLDYIGWYRDYAFFGMDDGRFARVDLRPEITEVTPVPCFEACCRVGTDPLQPPLPREEIARLRRLYEENDW